LSPAAAVRSLTSACCGDVSKRLPVQDNCIFGSSKTIGSHHG